MSRRRPAPAGVHALVLPLLLLVLAPAAFAGEPTGETPAGPTVEPEALLVAGPLPLHPPGRKGHPDTLKVEFIPEVEPGGLWPEEGASLVWGPGMEVPWEREVLARKGLLLESPPGRHLFWAAAYLDLDRFTGLTVTVEGDGDLRLFIDGRDVGQAGLPGERGATVKGKARLHRGRHQVLLRAVTDLQQTASAIPRVTLTAAADLEGARLSWHADPPHPPADFDALREVVRFEGLALSPDGCLLAAVRAWREPEGETVRRRLEVHEVDTGLLLASGLGGEGAGSPLWRPDGGALLFRKGRDLWLWDREGGSLQAVLRDEPGLGSVAWAPDGRFLVFTSTNGAPEPPAEEAGPRRRRELREKLADWPTRPHLHLMMLESGVSRRLTLPGDWIQDAFEVLPDGRTLLYLLNVPLAERPWFATEVHLRDLLDGSDRTVATLRMGFENRPGLEALRVSPDGTRVAFTGPPAELGLDGPERNAFDPDLWVLDLEDGSFFNVTKGIDPAADGPLWWEEETGALVFRATEGSVHRLYRAVFSGKRGREVAFERLLAPTRSIRSVSADGTGRRVAGTGSETWTITPHALPVLWLREQTESAPLETARLLEDPNAGLGRRWVLAGAEDASFRNGVGDRIEAWLYRPPGFDAPDGKEKAPLIVYYYGGSSPTLRGFSGLHQGLVANGYAVLVINPRGAAGYGSEFADVHVNDWGRKAGRDILDGLEALLVRETWIDPEKIGCFGGSYGGFMTLSLLTQTDRFAAAVSLFGISDLASYWGEGMWGWTYGDQALAGAYPWNRPEILADLSPLYHADRIETPVLLMHGDVDGNVPPGESEQMFTALRILGVPAELVRFPGEDHGLSGTWTHRTAYRTMMLEWFDRWLRGQPEAWAARWKDSAE